jgi:hypothetical protein
MGGRSKPRDGRAEQTLSLPLGTVWGVERPEPSASRPEATQPGQALLERVRKLLAKAEDDSVTPAEAEALTAKAAELMARYGIDRALLAATRPETDRPADRMIDVPNPWADVRAHLLAGLVSAMRCQCVLLPVATGKRVHVFGYASDLERTELLYTSLLVQMAHGLAATQVPATARSPRAWRRSWLLGYSSAVTARVRAAEERAASDATSSGRDSGGTSTELVLADRSLVVRRHVQEAYPRTRRTRITYSGNGYRSGYAEGERADIGGKRVRPGSGRALTS